MTKEEMKTLREGYRLTQKELAQEMGMNPKHIGHLEQGNRRISRATEAALRLVFARHARLAHRRAQRAVQVARVRAQRPKDILGWLLEPEEGEEKDINNS